MNPVQTFRSGFATPAPLDFDPTMNYARRIYSPASTGSFPVANGGYLEITGNPVGWTFQPEGASGPSIPLVATACFPVPKDGILLIDTAGTGTLTVIEWPPEIGKRIAEGRGYAPPGSGDSVGAGGAIARAGFDTNVTSWGNVAGVATLQIQHASGTLLTAGATKACLVILNVDPDNGGKVYVGTATPVVAPANVIGPGGQDTWQVPAGGKLFILGSAAAQTVGTRVRS